MPSKFTIQKLAGLLYSGEVHVYVHKIHYFLADAKRPAKSARKKAEELVELTTISEGVSTPIV